MRSFFRSAAQAFSINRDHARTATLSRPSREKSLKGFVIKRALHPLDRLRRSYAAFERQNAAKPLDLHICEKNNLIDIVHAAQLPHKQHEEYFQQRINDTTGKPRIGTLRRPLRENLSRHVI